MLTPTLPEEILAYQRNPIIRILRVVGGLSCLSLLGRGIFNLQGLLLYISIFFTIVFLIYHLYLLKHRYRHIKKMLKSEELDVRNSPLDRYASIIAKAIFCAKGVCETAQPVGLTLGLMLGFDEVLKAGGREALFAPMIGSGVNKILPQTNLTK